MSCLLLSIAGSLGEPQIICFQWFIKLALCFTNLSVKCNHIIKNYQDLISFFLYCFVCLNNRCCWNSTRKLNEQQVFVQHGHSLKCEKRFAELSADEPDILGSFSFLERQQMLRAVPVLEMAFVSLLVLQWISKDKKWIALTPALRKLLLWPWLS